ncbi:MAG: phytase [Weeksellaceae bacterium]
MKKNIILLSAILFASCHTARLGEQQSLGLNITNTTTADVETAPTHQGREDDSADDPAIWVNTKNSEASVVFGTDKMAGIASYDLSGKELSYDLVGRINNIDIRQNIEMNGEKIDVIAGTNRSNNNLVIGTIDSQGSVNYQSISGTELLKDKEVYGFCLGYVKNQLQAFVNDKSGNIFIYDLNFDQTAWTAQLSKQLKVKTQPEGMVVDDELHYLYVGEEENTVWKINLGDYSFHRLQNASEASNKNLKYDIEGISIYKTNERDGYVILSSQGNNSYAIYKREGNNEYIKSFRIVDGEIDGVEETDGLDFTHANLGSQFPKGIMVVQDGFNYDDKKKKSQNFKIIDWRKVEALILK